MFGTSKIYLFLSAVIAALVVWLRLDAKADERKKIETDAVKSRYKHISDTVEREHEVQDLSRDDLHDALSKRVLDNNNQ